MANRVLDTWALLAFFEDESAAEAVEELLDQASRGRHRLYLTSINWVELYCITMRGVSQEAAERHAQIIADLPIEIVGVDDDLKLARQAATIAVTHQVSMADAFAAALSKEKKAELVTGNEEFRPLEKVIKIHWLPQ